MKQFEVGKLYWSNGGGLVRIDRRTRCYVYYTVKPDTEDAWTGKARILPENLFQLGEHFLMYSSHKYMKAFKYFCFATKEA